MKAGITLPWVEPLQAAAGRQQPFVLLYSGTRTSYSGRYSYLATGLRERIDAPDFHEFETKLHAGQERFDGAWFGYLGYGLKDSLEALPADEPGFIALAKLCMMRFGQIYQFDHDLRELTLWSDDGTLHPLHTHGLHTPLIPPAQLFSNMTRGEYLQKAQTILEAIHRGDLYQANLTRKFMGKWHSKPDAFSVFCRLCEVSPAPYSAFLQLGDVQIASSSPELFLHISADGRVQTRPIKGTAPRLADMEQDAGSARALAQSEKDRAENLMIVDLMRNDLSRSATLGSVKVDSLFDITTHATIHHMSSTISAQRARDKSTLDIVRGCFPPGSMTGAPKIHAMTLCSQLEKQARGVYSGGIGWFGGDGSCELSVVIRTLVIKDELFEFQVGGGIVADSTPENELQETIEKSRGLLAALGISASQLEAL